jgi:hypothetical protein
VRRCETCAADYEARPEGDLADLNNLCRACACECAAQLEIDYGLPEGASDDLRQAALMGTLARGPEQYEFSPDGRRVR